MATGAVPAKKKVVQATKSPASSPHPTTRRRQRLKASEFKSEPRWDFEEEYSLDMSSLQTNCSASVKIKASKSPWLQNIFLPNITLFLDSGRFTQSEWNRLEHFAPPFGFMELNQSRECLLQSTGWLASSLGLVHFWGFEWNPAVFQWYRRW